MSKLPQHLIIVISDWIICKSLYWCKVIWRLMIYWSYLLIIIEKRNIFQTLLYSITEKKLLSIYKIHIPKTHQLSSGIVKLYYLNIIKVKKYIANESNKQCFLFIFKLVCKFFNRVELSIYNQNILLKRYYHFYFNSYCNALLDWLKQIILYRIKVAVNV